MAITYRKHVRKRAERLPVNVRAVGTFEWKPATVIDMSQGGLQINVNDLYYIGEKIELEFVTVDRTGKKVRKKFLADVRWRRGMRYGCQFGAKA